MLKDAGIDYLYAFPNEVPLPILRKVEVIRALLERPRYSSRRTSAEWLNRFEFGEFLKEHIDADIFSRCGTPNGADEKIDANILSFKMANL